MGPGDLLNPSVPLLFQLGCRKIRGTALASTQATGFPVCVTLVVVVVGPFSVPSLFSGPQTLAWIPD